MIIENTAEDDPEVAIITDFTYSSSSFGLQAIDKAVGSSSIITSYVPSGKRCDNVFTIEPFHRLYPGDTMAIGYRAVPILYPGPIDYGVNAATCEIAYEDAYGSYYDDIFTFSAVGDSTFDALVEDGINNSDYLLVTNPYNLLGLYDQTEANGVLDKMAELAILQNGVLGYFNSWHVLETEFEEGDEVALSNEHIFGSGENDEIVVADLDDNLIRVYNAFEEVVIETETDSHLPISHLFDEGDAIAVGDVKNRNSAGDPHGRREIVVAETSGLVTIYQYEYTPGDGEFTSYDFYTPYDEGSGFAVGNVTLGMGSEHLKDEIIVIEPSDDPSVRAAQANIYQNFSRTPDEGYSTSFKTGDKLAVGRLFDSDRERIIIANIERDEIRILLNSATERHLVEEYSIPHPLSPEDTLTVGDVWGNEREEVILADEDDDTIWVYSYDDVRDEMLLVAVINYTLQAEDVISTANVFVGDKEEILVTRGRSFSGHSEGDIEILSMTFGESPGDRYALDALINEHCDWADQLCDGSSGTCENFVTDGYLLLVGEIEIIPAFSPSWDLTGSDRGSVDYSDRTYGSTSGNTNYPELSVGRIIGDSAARLQVPLQASIDILNGDKEFDNSDAFLVSGRDRGASGEADDIDFSENRDSVGSSLRSEGFTTDLESNPSEAEFFSGATNTDVILIAGHGWRTGWDVIERGEVEGRFRPARHSPLIYAASCLTGRYPGGRSIAEAFLNEGASGYIGATEVGIWPWSGRLVENYFGRLDPTRTVGSALKHAKIHRLGVNTYAWDPNFNRYTCAIFHLYGDPKLEVNWLSPSATVPDASSSPFVLASYSLGVSSSSDQGTVADKNSPSAPEISMVGPLFSIEISIPDYEVTTVDSKDYPSIPGGDTVLAIGMPQVPSYSVFVDYPAHSQIQDVSMVQRRDMVTDTGLNIPDVVPLIADDEIPGTQQVGEDLDWWPDREFDWTTIKNPDDTLTLVITTYPFLYNLETTDVEFYRSFEFDIDYTISDVKISALQTDRVAYEQGQSVQVEAFIHSTADDAMDIIANTVITSENGDVVDGLPLQTLKDMQGLASLAFHWDSAGFDPGNYVMEMEIRTPDGELLDTEQQMFKLGISSGMITSLTVIPEVLDAGDTVGVEMTFANTGSMDIIGSAIIRMQDKNGATIEEYIEEFTALSPDNDMIFSVSWVATQGSGRVVGYVLYDGKSTAPSMIDLKPESADEEVDITSTESDDDSSNLGLIIGIVLGVLLVAVIGGIVWTRKR